VIPYFWEVWGGNNIAYYYIDSVSVIDVTTLGIESNEDNDMQIYPNPANDILFIETKLFEAEITLFDILGNEIRKEKISSKAQIDVSELTDGIYFIQVSSSQGILSKKIIIRH